jgi:hypothetical protein
MRNHDAVVSDSNCDNLQHSQVSDWNFVMATPETIHVSDLNPNISMTVKWLIQSLAMLLDSHGIMRITTSTDRNRIPEA